MKQFFNLPNQLTISRIAVAPIIAVLMALNSRWSCLAATALFGLAAFTDVIDGYLARKYKLVTSLGKFLDPLADKVLVSVILIMLVRQGKIAEWTAMIIICRELMVTGLRGIAADEGVVIAADRYGKAKTIIQLIALAPLILHYSWFGVPVHAIGEILLYIALVLTVFSGCNYFYNFFRTILAREKAQSSGEIEG